MSLYDKLIAINDRFIITTYKHILYARTKKRLSTFDMRDCFGFQSLTTTVIQNVKKVQISTEVKKYFQYTCTSPFSFFHFARSQSPVIRPSVRYSHRTNFREVSYLEFSDKICRDILTFVKFRWLGQVTI